MTLQYSGAISFANVQTEFGGSNPIGINEYYGVAAGVPGSGTISLYNFYGKSAYTWAYYVMGSSSINSESVSFDTYTGNVITPGAAASPTTFTINSGPSGTGVDNLFYAYLNGGIHSTFHGYRSNTSFTWAFGGGSIQFRSSVASYYNTGYIQVTVPAAAPPGLQPPMVYTHELTYSPASSDD